MVRLAQKLNPNYMTYVSHHRGHHHGSRGVHVVFNTGGVDNTEHALGAVSNGGAIEEGGVCVVNDLGDCGHNV